MPTTAASVAILAATRLRSYRAKSGETSQVIAKRMGVAHASLFRHEEGDITKLKTIEQIAKLLGITFEQVMEPLSKEEKLFAKRWYA